LVEETLMRGMRSTLALLMVAIGLGGYIYFVESERPPGGPVEPLDRLFNFNADDITALTVASESGDRTVLEKTDNRWQLVAPFESNVDITGLVAVTSSLATLKIQRVVVDPDDAPDLAVFGLADPRIEIAVTTMTGANVTLQIGEHTPTGSDLYATVAGSNRVFLISGFLEETLNRGTFDLRDKTILDFTRDQVDSLLITRDDLTIELRKDDRDWSLISPIAASADFAVADGIVGRLSTGQMVSIEAESTTELEPYSLDTPRLTVQVGLGSSAATLFVGGSTQIGTAYARDAARSLVFTVNESLVSELEQSVDDYRRKTLFAFRPFNATALELDQNGHHWTFEKTAAAVEGESESWRRTAPSVGDVDPNAMDDLLTKLSDLRAESFVDSREGTGRETPISTVMVTFNDAGEQESVLVGRIDDNVYALVNDQPGAAKLDLLAWENVLKALDALE
jgi:hypothetical protein